MGSIGAGDGFALDAFHCQGLLHRGPYRATGVDFFLLKTDA
jgi:hypothetical protein